MKIHQIRNATIVLEYAGKHILVDPMLAEPGVYPGFKMFGGGRQNNPLVPLPSVTDSLLGKVTDVLLTHEHHIDHFDPPALKWVKNAGVPVWASQADVPNLIRRGVTQAKLAVDGSVAPGVAIVPAKHGTGLFGFLMGPGAGYVLSAPGEPTVYLTGDTVMTKDVREVIRTYEPDLIVAAAGSANMGIGPDILFSFKDLIELARIAPGKVMYSHLESLDHCPTTRTGLREALEHANLGHKAYIPKDGECIDVSAEGRGELLPFVSPHLPQEGFHKWVGRKVGGV